MAIRLLKSRGSPGVLLTLGSISISVAAVTTMLWSRHMLKRRRYTESEGLTVPTDSSDSNGVHRAEVQTVDVEAYLRGTPEERAEQCRKAAQSLHHTGCLYIRDQRVDPADNVRFLDMMERYFEGSDGKRDARPEASYQVGVTPPYTEHPRNHCARAEAMAEEDRPMTLCPPEADPKWRFFWRIGSRPATSRFTELQSPPVVPPEFSEWSTVMDNWGQRMLNAVVVVAEMAALGFGLPMDAFTERMKDGPHLLAPTGSDLGRLGEVGTVLAALHYDLNMFTIHGQSRYPGLHIWLRDGRKMAVRVPEGCLLVQAGKQIEYLTGGHVLAGFHEVVVSSATREAIERRRAEGKSLWRVSSTLFSHIATDQMMEPLAHFATEAAKQDFPPIHAGEQVREELRVIKMGSAYSLNGKTAPEE